MNETCKRMLEKSRNNYITLIQTISEMQKEFEEIVIKCAENNYNHQKENIFLYLNNWVKMGATIKESFQSIFEGNLNNRFESYSAHLLSQDKINQLNVKIQESFKKYFENMNNFNFLR